jgi:hypothetical protein
MILIGAFVAIGIFIYLKNRQDNRAIDRRNRLAEKQEELIEMLQKKNESENKKDNEN